METTTTTDTMKATAAATVLQRSVCLMLRTSGIGNERNVNLSAIELKKRKLDGADETIQHKDEYRLSQQLVDKKVLAPARSAVDGVKRWLGGVATRSHRVFGPGTYLIAIPDLEMVEARLEQFRDDIHALGAKLAAEWDAEVEKRKELLGPTFNAADYMRAVEVMDAFDIDWSYVSFAAPDKLEDVSHVLASKANQKYQAKLAAAFDEILLDLRGDALRIMRELVDRLKPGLDGKPKALRETALRDLQDYLARLPNRNTVVGDDPLVAVMTQVQAYADGIDVDVLKKAPSVRAGLLAKAEEASAILAGLVEEAGLRGISFGGAL